jgi:hypothetical protein
LFHVVPRVPGVATNIKTGPVVLFGQTKPVLIVSIENVLGTSAIMLAVTIDAAKAKNSNSECSRME